MRQANPPLTSSMTAFRSINGLKPYLIRAIGNFVTARDKGNGRICIINYHRVLEETDPLFEGEPDASVFRWQMEVLASCFNVLSIEAAVAALEERRVPPMAVCITFDDGYRNIHDVALPILSELGLPATVFVTTGTMDGGTMWNDTIAEAIRRLSTKTLDLRDIGLGIHSMAGIEDKRRVIDRLVKHAKYLTPEGRASITVKLESLINGPLPDMMLDRQMIRHLAGQGIEIGGHTVSHPILTMVEDEQASEEIRRGKSDLEAITGKAVRFFAYPNGKPKIDFNDRHVKMVKDAGYVAAFTTVLGPATASHDRFHLPRSRPWDTTPFLFTSRLLAWLAGRTV